MKPGALVRAKDPYTFERVNDLPRGMGHKLGCIVERYTTESVYLPYYDILFHGQIVYVYASEVYTIEKDEIDIIEKNGKK